MKSSVRVTNQAAMPERRAGGRPDPAVLLIGAGDRAGTVHEIICRLGLPCHVSSRATRSMIEALLPAIRLVVIVPPIADPSAESLCRILRTGRHRNDIPILVVGVSRERSGRLHEAGASGLFAWPGERMAFARAVLRLAGTVSALPEGNPRDAALAARVEERLRAERDFGPLVTARVRRGVVFLTGEVDALWKISEITRVLSGMPGVEEVVTSGVRIPVSGIPDREISRSLRRMLRKDRRLEDRTFGIRVSNGRVIVTGTALSRAEMDRVVRLIERVDGVRGIENFLVISPRSKSRDRSLAIMLSRLVSGRFPDTAIDLSVFGKTVVLYGKAASATQRRAIESLAASQEGVERVVSPGSFEETQRPFAGSAAASTVSDVMTGVPSTGMS